MRILRSVKREKTLTGPSDVLEAEVGRAKIACMVHYGLEACPDVGEGLVRTGEVAPCVLRAGGASG